MGREARRVPLDFDWPLNKTWAGYLMPDSLHGDKCLDCTNGYTDAHEWLEAVAYCVAGLADDAADEARGRQMHPYLTPLREISYNGAKGRPGPQFAEFTDGIAPEAAGGFMGRDVYRVLTGLKAAAGLPERWGICPTCDGHATVEKYPGQRADADEWEPTDPPEGEGWQMWETTSEGSPISPVFATASELASWCADNVGAFGDRRVDAAEWLRIITGEQFGVEIAPGMIFI